MRFTPSPNSQRKKILSGGEFATEKTPPNGGAFKMHKYRDASGLALAGFEPRVGFVDHVNAAFTTYDTAVTVTAFKRTKRIANFHRHILISSKRGGAFLFRVLRQKRSFEFMVGDTRIELVTPSMSTKCSTAELIAHECQRGPCPRINEGAESRAGLIVSIKGLVRRIKGF